jgi:hypothetical protein
MRKAVSLSDIPTEKKGQIVHLFINGHKTFKETCLDLGLTEDQLRDILSEDYWDSIME